jgi:hypothetical protein
MTADREDRLAELVLGLGRGSSGPMGFGPTPTMVSAAVISKPRLVVVTVAWGSCGQPKVVVARSGAFDLADRSSRSIELLHHRATAFFKKQRIDKLYLRAKSADGQYVGHPLNFKIETVLQMVPGLTLTFVDTQSVGGWVRREEPYIPAAPLSLGTFWETKQKLALETALFLPENMDHARAFSEGTERDG